MKRMLAVVAASILMVLGLVQPAYAVHHGENCVERQYNNHTADRWVCVSLNTSDISLGAKLEALLEVYRDSAPSDEPYSDVSIDVDYTRLFICNNSTLGSCGNQVRGYSPGGWYPVDWRADGDFGTSDGAGGWYHRCNDGGSNGHWYVARTRYRLRWDDIAGDPIGDWKTQDSDVTWLGSTC